MSDQVMTEVLARLGGLEGVTGTLASDVARLKTDVAGLKTDVSALKGDVSDLRRHMGVLHEDVLDRIKGIREDDSLRREMRAGFAEIRQMFLDHTVPGDAADRRFAVTLNDHERRLQALETSKDR